MFLLRAAFWLTLVVMLLPTDGQSQKQVFGVARAAFSDLSSFCERNPDVCTQSKEAFSRFSDKAQAGAKMMMDLVRPSHQSVSINNKDSSSSNTLKADDLKPIWVMPSSNFGA